MRERRKLNKVSSGADANSVLKITWPYFKLLLFLNPSLQHKHTSGNVLDIEHSNANEDPEEQSNSPQVSNQESQEESQEEESYQELQFQFENRSDDLQPERKDREKA